MKEINKNNNLSEEESILRWGVFRSFFLLLIRLYQRFLSPFIGGQCRFYPSCSDYALLNFSFRSLPVAFFSSFWRILRCNPWNQNTGVEYPYGISERQSDLYLKQNSLHWQKHKNNSCKH